MKRSQALLLFVLLVSASLLCAQSTPAGYTLNSVYTPFSGGAFGDYNGDGKLDYALLCSGAGPVLTWIGRGDGFLGQRPPALPSSCSAGGAVSGDFNGDHKLDLVSVNASPYAALSFALGNGDGTFQAPEVLTFPAIPAPSDCYMCANGRPSAIYTADFNGNGFSDLLVADNYGDLVLYLADQHGGFSSPSVGLGAPSYLEGATIADLNGDGKPDLLLITDSVVMTDSVVVLLSNGDGTFTRAAGNSTLIRASDNGQVADLNGDGKLDLVLYDKNAKAYLFLAGDGAGGFLNPVTALAPGQTATSPASAPAAGAASAAVPIQNAPAAAVLIDIDQDGKPDLVFPENSSPGDALDWAKGKGDGTFLPGAFLVNTSSFGQLFQAVTLDNDKNAALVDGSGNLYLPAHATSSIGIGPPPAVSRWSMAAPARSRRAVPAASASHSRPPPPARRLEPSPSRTMLQGVLTWCS